MSWLVNTIANSLKLDEDATTTNSEALQPENPNNGDDQQSHHRQVDSADTTSPSDHQTTPRGVKDDLSEFSKTLTRQFWGVASFLAPPPPISDRDLQTEDSDQNSDDLAGITGIRNDLSEIGGKFRTGISKLSSNKAVSEFTKIATNLLQFASEEDLSIEDYAQRGVVGVTEEVVGFARDVSMHPETWIDFPLPDDEEDEEFDLSDAQQEHALAVERLAPELAALRTELCLGYMNEGSFWKIYFVLVHPRLSREDAAILSSPQIVKARAMLTQELHSRGKSRSFDSRSGKAPAEVSEVSREEHLSVPIADQSEFIPVEISTVEPASTVEANLDLDKHPVTTAEIPVIDKAVVDEVSKKPTESGESTSNTNQKGGEEKEVAEENSKKQMDIKMPIPDTSKCIEDQNDEDDVDDWLKEDNTEESSSFKGTSYQIGNDDDVSFSDLEEEDVPTSYNTDINPNDVYTKDRSGSKKVSAHNLEKKESNDWLDIEDIDDA